MNKWALFYLGLGLIGTVGCNVEVVEDHDDAEDDWYSDGGIQSTPPAICVDYCDHLAFCEVLDQSAVNACLELCEKKYNSDYAVVSEGCECVIGAGCIEEESEQCQDAPLPQVWSDHTWGLPVGGQSSVDDSTGSTGGADGTGGSGGKPGQDTDQQSDGPTCTDNHECGSGEDCIGEQCLARCAASCQCQDGQACEEGYCRTPEEPKIECKDTCDCTAGDQCVNGQCE
jgi:hypothetical protein